MKILKRTVCTIGIVSIALLQFGCAFKSQDELSIQAYEAFTSNDLETIEKTFKNLDEEHSLEFEDKVHQLMISLSENSEYEKAIEKINIIANIESLNEFVSDEMEFVDSMKESNELFNNAEKLYKAIDFSKESEETLLSIQSLLEQYRTVSNMDKLNYSIALKRVDELSIAESNLGYAINKEVALKFYENKNFDEAIQHLDIALKYKSDDTTRKLRSDYVLEQKEFEEKKNQAIRSKVYKKSDDMTGVDWYNAKNTPKQITGTIFQAYMGKLDDFVWLRFRTGFHKDDWIFFEEITVKADDYRFNIAFDEYEDKETDVKRGIYEWIDISAEDELIENLKMVYNSSSAKIRFSGDAYHTEHTITQNQKKRLREIIEFYELEKSTEKSVLYK